MNSNLCYANAVTPTPRKDWLQMSDEERLELVNGALASDPAGAIKILMVTEVRQDGQVIVKFLESIGADRRGTVLLDFEQFLKATIDPCLTVWLEPLGDRSSLRNLRGIEVKS